MKQQIDLNLNNLHLYYSALGSETDAGVTRHTGWPHKLWQQGFSLTDEGLELGNHRLVAVQPLPESLTEPTKLSLKSQLVMMNLKLEDAVNGESFSAEAAIEEIAADEVAEWVESCGMAFGYEIDVAPFELLLTDANANLLAYKVNGEIAGTAIGYKTGDTLGVHQVGVVPSFRGQGLAYKLMLELLKVAHQQGCNTISLQASKAGLPLYEKLGFKQLGPIFQYC